MKCRDKAKVMWEERRGRRRTRKQSKKGSKQADLAGPVVHLQDGSCARRWCISGRAEGGTVPGRREDSWAEDKVESRQCDDKSKKPALTATTRARYLLVPLHTSVLRAGISWLL